MANNRVFIGWPNYVDVGFYTPVLSGGSWLGGAPLANLQNPRFAYKSRSTNALATSTRLDFDLGTLRAISAVVIPRHNLSRAATVTVSLYAESGHTTLLGSLTVSVFPVPAYGWGSIPFGAPNWFDGSLTDEQLAMAQVPVLVLFPTPVAARYGRVQITDTANPAGYVELQRLFITPGWQPSMNVSYGAALGVEDSSIVTTSPGGADFIDQRPKRRTFTGQIPYLDQDEALANEFDRQVTAGIAGQVFFSFAPQDAANLFRHSFVAVPSRLDALKASAFNRQGITLDFREVVA